MVYDDGEDGVLGCAVRGRNLVGDGVPARDAR